MVFSCSTIAVVSRKKNRNHRLLLCISIPPNLFAFQCHHQQTFWWKSQFSEYLHRVNTSNAKFAKKTREATIGRPITIVVKKCASAKLIPHTHTKVSRREKNWQNSAFSNHSFVTLFFQWMDVFDTSQCPDGQCNVWLHTICTELHTCHLHQNPAQKFGHTVVKRLNEKTHKRAVLLQKDKGNG